jgi:hypothetical protein
MNKGLLQKLALAGLLIVVTSCATPDSQRKRYPSSSAATTDSKLVAKPESIAYITGGKTRTLEVDPNILRVLIREGDDFGYGKRSIVILKENESVSSDILEIGKLAEPLTLETLEKNGSRKVITLPADIRGGALRVGIPSNADENHPNGIYFFIGDEAALEIK